MSSFVDAPLVRLGLVVAVPVAASSLSGCSLLNPSPTVAEAQQVVWQMEDEILDFVPREHVLARWRATKKSRGYACEPSGAALMAAAWLTVDDQLDQDKLLQRFVETWRTREGWRTEMFGENAVAYILHPDGYLSSIWFVEDGMTVATWTPCLNIPDYSPYEEY